VLIRVSMIDFRPSESRYCTMCEWYLSVRKSKEGLRQEKQITDQ